MITKVRPYPHFKFPSEIEISFKLLSDSDCQWFNVKKGSYEITCINYGWFPTEVLMGVIKGNFADTNNLGATISGNMGSRSIAVTDIKRAVELLTVAGYPTIKEVKE
jgi:hypothetical protein